MHSELMDLLSTQAGVIARWQARALGMSLRQLDNKLATKQWLTRYPGIYVTSDMSSAETDLWVAILLCSKEVVLSQGRPDEIPAPDAVLSHETAAGLYGLRDADPGAIHLTVPTSRRKPSAACGITVHMSIRLDDTRHPSLSPPRTRLVPTVIDLTQTARTTDDAIAWLTRACGQRLATPDQLLLAITGRKKLRWRGELVQGLTGVAVGNHSILELRYHANVELAHGLPTGRRQRRRQAQGNATYDDVAYDEYATVVELDGQMGHEYEGKFRDRRRDNATAERGGVPLRYGYADVDDAPCATAAQVARVLSQRGWAGHPTPCSRPGCAVRRFRRS